MDVSIELKVGSAGYELKFAELKCVLTPD